MRQSSQVVQSLFTGFTQVLQTVFTGFTVSFHRFYSQSSQVLPVWVTPSDLARTLQATDLVSETVFMGFTVTHYTSSDLAWLLPDCEHSTCASGELSVHADELPDCVSASSAWLTT